MITFDNSQQDGSRVMRKASTARIWEPQKNRWKAGARVPAFRFRLAELFKLKYRGIDARKAPESVLKRLKYNRMPCSMINPRVMRKVRKVVKRFFSRDLSKHFNNTRYCRYISLRHFQTMQIVYQIQTVSSRKNYPDSARNRIEW